MAALDHIVYPQRDFKFYPYCFLSFIGFFTIYKHIIPRMTLKFYPSFLQLHKSKKIEFCSRICSCLHAFVLSASCIYVFLYEDAVHLDSVWGHSELVKYNCAIVVGYMLCDTLIILCNYAMIGEFFYVLHHFAAIYAYYYVMSYGALAWFANFRLLSELSTPFVHARWFMMTLNVPKSSRLFLLNGVLVVTMFFLVRMCTIPIHWHRVYTIYGTESCNRLGNIWYALNTTCFIIDSINIYWFYKVMQGMYRVVTVSSGSKKY